MKIISSIVSCLLFVSSVGQSSDITLKKESIEQNIEYKIINSVDDKNIYEFNFINENITYLAVCEQNSITIVDESNYQIITSASIQYDTDGFTTKDTYINSSDLIDEDNRLSPDDYERWFNWTNCGTYSLHINNISGTVLSALQTILIAFVSDSWNRAKSIFVDISLSIINNIANSIYNNQYSDVYGVFYMRNNTFCTTLSQEKTSFFTNSGVSIGTTGVANHWNLDPYDPMSDYACRILAQRY